MGAIGKKLRRAIGNWDGKPHVRLMHWCPGCAEVHGITVEGGPPTWAFNGDYEAPAFEPSVRIFITHTKDDDDRLLPAQVQETLCHYFIRTGAQLLNRGANVDPAKSYIDFCGDSPHDLRGKIVELPDWPYDPETYGGIEE
jgi:hypothetical protein